MLVNVVDVPPLCNFILPAIVRTGPLAIAISTAGASPALAKRMAREIAEQFGEPYARLADLLPRSAAGRRTRCPPTRHARSSSSRSSAASRTRSSCSASGDEAGRARAHLRCPATALPSTRRKRLRRRRVPARARAAPPRTPLRRPRRARLGFALAAGRRRRSWCSARTAPARRRCCGCSAASCARTPARCVCWACELPRERWYLRGRVGWLGHEPLLYRELTARENLRFHARLHGARRSASRRSLAGGGHVPARRRAAARALAGHGPARRRRARGARRSGAAAARRAAREPRSCGDARARAADRPRVRPHPRDNQPRPAAGLAEADLVLGLRDGRPVLAARADAIEAEELAALYA